MANTERRGNGEAGSRSGSESPERVAIATDEGLQAERICGEERGLTTALELKPKRVVFPIAGKGGVGKTTVMATLAEWYATTAYTADLFDMDPDNKAEGCFKALFAKAHKLPALESWTYDKLLGISLESSADVILADLGAAQGHRMIPWFGKADPMMRKVYSRHLQYKDLYPAKSGVTSLGKTPKRSWR